MQLLTSELVRTQLPAEQKGPKPKETVPGGADRGRLGAA